MGGGFPHEVPRGGFPNSAGEGAKLGFGRPAGNITSWARGTKKNAGFGGGAASLRYPVKPAEGYLLVPREARRGNWYPVNRGENYGTPRGPAKVTCCPPPGPDSPAVDSPGASQPLGSGVQRDVLCLLCRWGDEWLVRFPKKSLPCL